jgi:hypothetical protein
LSSAVAAVRLVVVPPCRRFSFRSVVPVPAYHVVLTPSRRRPVVVGGLVVTFVVVQWRSALWACRRFRRLVVLFSSPVSVFELKKLMKGDGCHLRPLVVTVACPPEARPDSPLSVTVCGLPCRFGPWCSGRCTWSVAQAPRHSVAAPVIGSLWIVGGRRGSCHRRSLEKYNVDDHFGKEAKK